VPFKDRSSAGISTINNVGFLGLSGESTAYQSTITNDQDLRFVDASTAGNATITNQKNLTFDALSKAGDSTITNSADLSFVGRSTAGNATITNKKHLTFDALSTAGGSRIVNTDIGTLQFIKQSTAGNANIQNTAGASFYDDSNAGTATIVNNSNALFFNGSSSAEYANITNNNGITSFADNSSGGRAALVANGTGGVDFSYLTSPNGTQVGSLAGSGRFFLGANTITVGANNQSTTVSGVIQDGGANGGAGGALVKVGTGTLTLTGKNTYSGDTTISAGTLQLGNGFTTGSILGDVTNNGVLAFDAARSDVLTFAGVISGTGSVQQLAGGGRTVLTGNNTYTGGTTIISGGELTIGGGGTTGSIAGNVTNNGSLRFNRSDAFIFDGQISGPGHVYQDGSGTTRLAADKAKYTGQTFVARGSLEFAADNGNPPHTTKYEVATPAILAFSNRTVAGAAARVVLTNNGQVKFDDFANPGVITIINGGDMSFCSRTTQQCGAGLGNAKVTNNKTRKIHFVKTGTAGNSVIDNAGAIFFKDNGSGGDATINNSGTVFFQDFSASASVVLNNTSADAVVDLSSSKVNNKPMSAASIEGRGKFLLGSSVFTVGMNNKDSTVKGAISDGGQFGGTGASFVKEGTGTLTLAGENTWTGPTIVKENGGKLVANGKELGPGRYGPPPEFRPAR
jgi:autotransporter-associated beta strand protein